MLTTLLYGRRRRTKAKEVGEEGAVERVVEVGVAVRVGIGIGVGVAVAVGVVMRRARMLRWTERCENNVCNVMIITSQCKNGVLSIARSWSMRRHRGLKLFDTNPCQHMQWLVMMTGIFLVRTSHLPEIHDKS